MESPASERSQGSQEHEERLGEVGIKIGDLTSHRTPPELEDVEGGVGHGGSMTNPPQAVPTRQNRDASSATRCWHTECEQPAEGMLCRTHRIDAAAYLRETDPRAFVWDFLLWEIEAFA
jgi:hypothetical protein